MEIRRDVYVDQHGCQVTTISTDEAEPKVIFVTVTKGDEPVFVDNAMALAETKCAVARP